MEYIVLAAWVIQAGAGVGLVVRMLRGGRRLRPTAIVHFTLLGTALAIWVAFLAGQATWLGWLSFALMTIGNGFGDWMLVQRWRALSASRGGFWADYGKTVRAAMRGEFPKIVVFHALFSGVVYFTCLAACILASLSR